MMDRLVVSSRTAVARAERLVDGGSCWQREYTSHPSRSRSVPTPRADESSEAKHGTSRPQSTAVVAEVRDASPCDSWRGHCTTLSLLAEVDFAMLNDDEGSHQNISSLGNRAQATSPIRPDEIRNSREARVLRAPRVLFHRHDTDSHNNGILLATTLQCNNPLDKSSTVT